MNFGADGSRDGPNAVVRRDGDYVLWLAVDEGEQAARLELVPREPALSPGSAVGSMYDSFWSIDFPLREAEPGAYELVCPDLRAGDELKVRRDGSWRVNFGADGSRDGPDLVVPADGAYLLRLVPEDGESAAQIALTPLPGDPLGQELQVRLTTARLMDRWPLSFHLGQVNGEDQVPARYPEDLSGTLRILWLLEDTLQKMPEGFVDELCNGIPGTDDAPRRSIYVYIVRSIPGDDIAMAHAWSQYPALDFEIGDGLQAQVMAHELMHLMDLRLVSSDPGFESRWEALTPPEAAGAQDPGLIDSWYVSDYARSGGPAEDRAEVFAWLFNYGPREESGWCRGRSGVETKAAFLIEAIRAAFPSVRAVPCAWWER